MVKKIIKYPAPSLRVFTKAVLFPITDEVREHLRDLEDTLKASADGLAIASNQVLAEGHQVFIVRDVAELTEKFEGGLCFNPTWKPRGDDVITDREGCLSFPGMSFMIPRFESIIGEFQDIDGNKHSVIFDGLLARALQHEYDHLTGVLFIDMLPKKAQTQLYNTIVQRKKAGRW